MASEKYFEVVISKKYFAGDAALKAGGKDNTMNQFG